MAHNKVKQAEKTTTVETQRSDNLWVAKLKFSSTIRPKVLLVQYQSFNTLRKSGNSSLLFTTFINYDISTPRFHIASISSSFFGQLLVCVVVGREKLHSLLLLNRESAFSPL